MSQQTSPALRAYRNVGAFLAHRGYRLVAEPLRPKYLDEEGAGQPTPPRVVGDIMGKLGYWELVAETGAAPKKLVVVYFLDSRGKPAQAKPHLRKVLIQAGQKQADFPLGEVLVFADEAVATKKNLLEAVQDARREGPGVRYSMHPYFILATVLPDMPVVPRHEVMPPDEAAAYLSKFFLTKDMLPKILSTDPAVIWCGGRRGDYIRVWRRSEAAVAETPVVRYCSR